MVPRRSSLYKDDVLHRMSSRQYDRVIDLSVDNAHSRVIRLVGRRQRVLELGCSTGYMSRVLTERFGCVVTAVERDAAAAREASAVCRRVIVADLEDGIWHQPLEAASFDVVLCADVLEHLRDPARVLAGLRRLLARGGRLVASIPNVTHVGVVAELLQGRFTYRSSGLLDETHLRFFTRRTMYERFERAGFRIVHLERVCLPLDVTEFRAALSDLPPAVADVLRSSEEAMTYQFVVAAEVDDEPRTGADRPARVEDAGDARADVSPADTSAEAAREARLAGSAAALLGRVRSLEEERAEQVRQVALAEDDARTLAAALAATQRRAESLEAELAAIRATRGWRLLERLRRVRDRFTPPRGRGPRA
jgi:SAM-dependent methyltransferase